GPAGRGNVESVYDEQLGARSRVRAVWVILRIGHLVAHSGAQEGFFPTLHLRLQLTLDDVEDVAPTAPMIGKIARRVLHHAHADAAHVPRPPEGGPLFAGVFDRRHLAPIGDREGCGGELHGDLPRPTDRRMPVAVVGLELSGTHKHGCLPGKWEDVTPSTLRP